MLRKPPSHLGNFKLPRAATTREIEIALTKIGLGRYPVDRLIELRDADPAVAKKVADWLLKK